MSRLSLLLTGLILGFVLALVLTRAGWIGELTGVSSVRRSLADQLVGGGGSSAGSGRGAAAFDDDDDDDHDDDDELPARLAAISGGRFVHLDAAALALAAIRVERLPVTQVTPEIRTVGVIADHFALAAGHSTAAQARERRAAQAETASEVGARLARLRALADGGRLGAARDIADLEVIARRVRERTLELAAAESMAEQALLARWGAPLVAATAPGTALAAALAGEQAAVVTFALPGRAAPPPALSVGVEGDRAVALPARLIGPAPGVLANAPGTSWQAVVEAPGLRHGMGVDVWVEREQTPLRGVLLPAEAVVWQSGRRWYFVAREPGLFERMQLPEQPEGLEQAFLPAAMAAVAVVTQGAQTLLGEEFRGAIPDEDDD